MKQLLTLGANKHDFYYLLSSCFYVQIVRPQLEYGLAIISFNLQDIRLIKNCQNQCIRQIFGGRPFTSTKVMLHITNLPTMKDRIFILQAKFLFCSSSLPDDALLAKLLPYPQSERLSQWFLLLKSILRQSTCNADLATMSFAEFKRKQQQQLLIDSRHTKLQEKHAKLLSQCCNDLIVHPILRIPMTRSERSRCVRWLPLGKPQVCSFHPNVLFTRLHSFFCLDMYNRLQMPKTITGPLSFLLNRLPSTFITTKARNSIDAWLIRWPFICAILLEIDYLDHSQFLEASNQLGVPFTNYLLSLQQQISDS